MVALAHKGGVCEGSQGAAAPSAAENCGHRAISGMAASPLVAGERPMKWMNKQPAVNLSWARPPYVANFSEKP